MKLGVYERTVLGVLTSEPQETEEIRGKVGFMPTVRYLDMTLLRLLDKGLVTETEPHHWIKTPPKE